MPLMMLILRLSCSLLSDLAPRHANSGSIMGAFSAMRAFFNELVEFMDSEAYDGYDDQGKSSSSTFVFFWIMP